MTDLRLHADSCIVARHCGKVCMAALPNLNEEHCQTCSMTLNHCCAQHTSVVVMYQRFDCIGCTQAAVQQKSVLDVKMLNQHRMCDLNWFGIPNRYQEYGHLGRLQLYNKVHSYKRCPGCTTWTCGHSASHSSTQDSNVLGIP